MKSCKGSYEQGRKPCDCEVIMDKVPVFSKKIKVAKPSTLSEDKVIEIKKLLNDGVPVKVISIEFNRSIASIYAIKHGLSYRNVT